MKPIIRHKKFIKNFQSRISPNPKLKKQFALRLQLFIDGVRDYPLDDHALVGTMKGLRAFSIGGDLRVVYRETNEYYEFLDVGTHNFERRRTMKYYDLDNDEQKILEAVENDGFQSVPDLSKRKQELQGYAKNSLNKTMNINIRLSERDVYKLKAKAAEEGLPYQTLAASILHKSAAR